MYNFVVVVVALFVWRRKIYLLCEIERCVSVWRCVFVCLCLFVCIFARADRIPTSLLRVDWWFRSTHIFCTNNSKFYLLLPLSIYSWKWFMYHNHVGSLFGSIINRQIDVGASFKLLMVRLFVIMHAWCFLLCFCINMPVWRYYIVQASIRLLMEIL